MAQKMHAKNSISGSLAECFVTIEGRRYNFMSLTEFDSNYEINIEEVPILGQVNMGHKPAGGKGTWSGKAHYNQSVLRKMIDTYQKTGYLPYFEIQITNEDGGSKIGRQTTILRDCLCDKVTLAKFAVGNNLLDEDISGTFESFDIPETFKEMDGFAAN